MNHCTTNKCSSYCLVITIITVLYNIINHRHVKDADVLTENSKHYVKLKLVNVGRITTKHEYLIVLEKTI